MALICRGTTPTIVFTFSAVDVSDIAVAYFTMNQGDTVIEHTLEEATVGENTLTWTLTQEETLDLNDKQEITVQCRYKLINGSACASKIKSYSPMRILKDGEI